MKRVSFVLNVGLSIVCVVLFFQNKDLQSELSLARVTIKEKDSLLEPFPQYPEGSLEASLSTARAKNLNFERAQKERSPELSSSGRDNSEVQIEEEVEERVQEQLRSRVEAEVQREMERHHQERMAHRREQMEQAENRMTEALYEHLEAVGWDDDVAEQVEGLVLDDIELHRDVHSQVAAGEIEHFEARAYIHEQKRAQREELAELIGPEQTHDLFEHLREARHQATDRP